MDRDEALGKVFLPNRVKIHAVQLLSTWDQSDKPLNSLLNSKCSSRQVK